MDRQRDLNPTALRSASCQKRTLDLKVNLPGRQAARALEAGRVWRWLRLFRVTVTLLGLVIRGYAVSGAVGFGEALGARGRQQAGLGKPC